MEEKIKEFVHSIPPENFSLQNYLSIKVKKLEAGCYNINYLLNINTEKFVFRYAAHSDGVEGNNLDKEYKTLKLLDGFYAPRAIYYFPNFPALIEEFIEGEKPKRLTDDLIKKLAQALASLHLVTTKNRPVSLQNYQARIDNKSTKMRESTMKVLQPYLEKAKKYIQEQDKRFSLISKQALNHGDMHCPNIILQENDIKFIDWENSSLTDPAFDIVAFFYESENGQYFSKENSITNEQKELFLSEYLKYHQDIYLKEKIDILTPLRWISDTLWIESRIFDFYEMPKESREKSIEEYELFLKQNIEVLKQFWQ